jgi:hypothetical protein
MEFAFPPIITAPRPNSRSTDNLEFNSAQEQENIIS